MNRSNKTLLPLLLLWASTSAADQIRLRADSWCPYNCEPDVAHPGFMIEIAKEVFADAGHDVDYQLLNWSRALADVRAGIADGAVGAYKTDAPDLVYPDHEMAVSKNCFFVSANQPWVYGGLPSLEGISLGVIKDYSYGPSVDQYIAGHKTDFHRIQVTSGDDALGINLRKLTHGRLDALVEDQYVFDHFLLTHVPTKPINRAGCDDQRNEVYVGFSPNNPKSAEYAAILSKGVEKLRLSGRLAAILSHYGLRDWQLD
jgi:polar amino acid transport system substrate-binding protein